MPVIEFENVSKTYRCGSLQVNALENISFSVEHGEFVAIMGQSGSGKSTLMNLIGCLDTATSGTCRIFGSHAASLGSNSLSQIRNKEIGFIFQGFNLIPGLTALENTRLPLLYRGIDKATGLTLSRRALERVGLSERLHHRPSQLSGGQQQRVAIARAIASSPPMILADEPTGNLDSKSGRAVLDILLELWREGRTLILITHDPAIAALAPRVIRISDGKLENL